MLALLLLIPLAIGAYTDFKRLAVSPGILGLIFVVGIAYNVLSFPEGMNPFAVPILYTLYWLRKYLGAPKTVELPFFTCFLIGYGVAITLFWDKVQMFKYILP